MIDKEYVQETLDKLKKDLKDINTYTSFKNGTYFYDLGFFQGSVLVDEIERYKNIIDELEKDLKNLIKSSEEVENKWASEICIFVLNKLKELKEGSDR